MQDTGLQPERTALAWRRTALALFVNGALVGRAGFHQGRGAVAAVGLGVMLLSAMVAIFSNVRSTALLAATDSPAQVRFSALLLVSIASSIASVTSIWIVLEDMLR